jgi:hypothetical protein
VPSVLLAIRLSKNSVLLTRPTLRGNKKANIQVRWRT